MRLCAEKNLSMAQPPVGQLATGVPSVEVSIDVALEETEEGTEEWVKNHIETPLSANSVTHTPPPAVENPAP